MEKQPIIPTLFVNQTIMKTDSEMLAYLLKFTFWNPGWTSSQLEGSLLSMRKLRANNTEDMNAFPNALERALNTAVQQYNANYHATVKTEVFDSTTYKLIITVADNFGRPIINSSDIFVRDGILRLRSEIDPLRGN